MKTELGISMAILAALAAEGKDFSRAELNAMLDKLAATPEPAVLRGPQAMCYKMMMPQAENLEYKCPKCKTVTRYASRFAKEDLAFFRDAVPELKGLGLDIALDESAVCRTCTAGPKKPVSARIKDKVEISGFQAGENVLVSDFRNGFCVIMSKKPAPGWIRREDVTNGIVSVEGACVVGSVGPGPHDIIVWIERGSSVVELEREAGDPEDMLRINASKWRQTSRCSVPVDRLEAFEYDEDDWALDDRFRNLAWVINGTRTEVLRSDVALLKNFLSGELIYRFGHGEEMALQKQLPRLRELLGEPKK